MLVEVWSDVVCPWCYVGKARFEAALADLSWADEVRVVYRPFELDPTVPPGGTDLASYLRHKFGSAATVERIEGRVTEAGAEYGLVFDWAAVRRVNTFDAHRLLAWSLEQAGPAGQADVKGRLMEAYFTGTDVADHGVLAHLAGEAALERGGAAAMLAGAGHGDAVRAGEREASELGIHAVPTYLVERRLAIPGAQEPATFVSLLGRARQRFAS